VTNSDERLPELLRPAFWDCEFGRLRWESDRELIVARVLAAGSWPMIRWLRDQLGDDGLREWMMGREGRGLTPKQIRFWHVLLDLPSDQVADWLQTARTNPWNRRIRR